MADFKKIIEKPALYEAADTENIKAVVGGINTDYFAPSANISFKMQSGKEQYFFNICDDVDQVKTVGIAENFDKNKLAIRDGDQESTFELKETSLKIERVFYVKPTVAPKYKLAFSPGVSFHYQPELTPEEIAEGCFRPDNVVGSYAVYCDKSGHYKDRSGNTIVNYGCGKIGHLYAPYWTDADGKKVKGTQEIKDGVLTFALPGQKWIDTATLPIKLDPDVGYDTAGGSSGGATGFAKGNHSGSGGAKFNFNTGTLDSFSAYVKTISSEGTVEGGLYDLNVSDEPNGLKHQTSSFNDITGTAAWVSGTMSGSITSGDYAITFAASGAVHNYYDAVSGAGYHNNTNVVSLPDPWSGTQSTGYNYSMYVTYTESGLLPINSPQKRLLNSTIGSIYRSNYRPRIFNRLIFEGEESGSTLLPIKYNVDEISKGVGPITASQLGGILVGG